MKNVKHPNHTKCLSEIIRFPNGLNLFFSIFFFLLKCYEWFADTTIRWLSRYTLYTGDPIIIAFRNVPASNCFCSVLLAGNFKRQLAPTILEILELCWIPVEVTMMWLWSGRTFPIARWYSGLGSNLIECDNYWRRMRMVDVLVDVKVWSLFTLTCITGSWKFGIPAILRRAGITNR